MTLKKYKELIDKILKEHPEYADFPLIYSSDDEGNNYQKLNYGPSPTHAERLDGYYVEVIGSLSDPEIDKKKINCICIN